jgi:hypothetical protein
LKKRIISTKHDTISQGNPSPSLTGGSDERREWIRIEDNLLLEYRLLEEPADQLLPVREPVTQEMIAQLGRLHPQSLSVIARTSVMRYKKTNTPIDQVAGQVAGIARSGYLDLRHHFADDDLKMFIVDVLTLRAINLLHFGEQIHLAGLATLDAQDAMWVERAFCQRFSGFHMVAIPYQQP